MAVIQQCAFFLVANEISHKSKVKIEEVSDFEYDMEIDMDTDSNSNAEGAPRSIMQ